jgi:hypothetical protein
VILIAAIMKIPKLDGPPPEPVELCCMMAYIVESDPVTAAARGERYNGRRPDYRGQRVSTRDYPDGTSYGWEFTGSCEGGRAEFFEKDFATQCG